MTVDSLNYSGKLVDPQPANTHQVFNKFWGIVKKASPLYGPDAYGAKYKQVSYEYQPVLHRTAIKLQSVVDAPKGS